MKRNNKPVTGWRAYYHLTKPGIIRGNLMTAAAGFLLAAQGSIDIWLLVATLLGIGLLIASACVFNNYIDRDIDAAMSRTKQRALVIGSIPVGNALVFASLLGIAAFTILGAFVNELVVFLGMIAFIDYVLLYGLAKRRWVAGTLVGSIAGALPIAAGYCAVTGVFDTGALLLFIILVLWQMPHFYAIAMYRLKDYQAAGIPVLPAVKKAFNTKLQIVLYIIGFILATSLLKSFGYTGNLYLVIMLLAGFIWLGVAYQGFSAKDNTAWARRLFFVSLGVLLVFSLLIAVAAWLP